MRAALVGVTLIALVVPASAAEKAVRRDETGKEEGAEKAVPRGETAKEPSPETEARHPAPARTSEPTAAPTSEPRHERREEHREQRKDTPAPTAEPTRPPDPTSTPDPTPTPDPTRTPTPDPTVTPDRRSDAERRHPRAYEPATPVEPPPASPVVRPRVPGDDALGTRPPRDHDDHARQDRQNRHHGPPRSRIGRGHLGPHYHHRRFVPESCVQDVVHEVEPGPSDDPLRANYDGMAALRLLVDPPETRVFVDGYFAGLVEDFDGFFERLHLPEGCHELTLVLAGYRTHHVRVYATPGRGLNIRHTMRAGKGADVEDLTPGLCRAEERPGPPPSARDFEIDRQHWFLAYGRLTTLVGLVRGELGRGGGSAAASVLVRVEARSDGGAVIASERESRVDLDDAGAFLTSYRLDLAPGRYALHLTVSERVSGRLSAMSGAVDVPDLHASEVAVPSVFILESMRTAPADPRHPLAALVLEQAMPVPRFGNRFRPSDAPMILFQFARRASASAILASYVILGPDATTVAQGARLQADHVAVVTGRAVGAAAFGPIPLAKYQPGLYRVLVTVTDVDSRAAYAQEAWFEVETGERTALSWPGDTSASRAVAPKP